jgi:hypothetical protein
MSASHVRTVSLLDVLQQPMLFARTLTYSEPRTFSLIIFYVVIIIITARCAYAAKAVGKDLDIFAIGTVPLNHIYTHQSEIVNIICSQS